MSITSYTELQSAITNWLGGRTDLTTYYADWITLFEAYAARKLRVRPMLTTATPTVTGGTGDLPTDFLGMERLKITMSDTQVILEYLHPSLLVSMFPTNPSGVPSFYTVRGSTFNVVPTTDTDASNSYQMFYYAKNTAVSATLNWLFNNFPDAYLNGALLEAAIFTRDDDGAVLFKARRDEIMDEVSKLNSRELSGLQIRVNQQTP